MEEIDSKIVEIQAKLHEFLVSTESDPHNAAELEALERTLQSLGKELADLIAAKKNRQGFGKRRDED
jgi:low affinity Fe/Cu permease